jgi:antitoxin ParD1/3/4
MTRTITIDTGEELRGFIESLVESGSYKTNSEVVREGLRLLQEKQAASKLETLRKLIDEGENSGEPVDWDVNEFLGRMKTKKHKHVEK